MTRKRKILLLIFGLIALAGIWAGLVGHGPDGKLRIKKTLTLYSSQIVGRNIRFPHLQDKHTLQFFTGTAFASLDLSSYHTRSLTGEHALPPVTNVEWGNGVALLEAQALTDEDDLYPLADTSARQSDGSWWLCDLSTGKFKQLRANRAGYRVIQAAWSIDHKIIFETLQQGNDASRQVLEAVNLATNQGTDQLPTQNVTSITATKVGLLVQQGTVLSIWQSHNLKRLPLTSNSTRQPFTAADGISFMYDDGSGASSASSADETTPTSGSEVGNLYAYNVTNNQQTLLVGSADNTGNTAAYQNGFLILPQAAQANQDQGTSAAQAPQTALLASVPSANSPIGYALQIGADDQRPIGNLRSALALTINNDVARLALTNTDNELVLVSTDPAVRQAASPYPLVFLDTDRGTVPDAAYLFDAVTNHLTIFVNRDDENSLAGRSKILQELGGPSEDPNQVQKSWRPLNPSES